MSKRFFLILMLIMALALVACGGDDEEPTEVAAAEETVAEEPVAEEMPELTALWFAWQPCEALGELAAMYEDATVTVNCVPIAEWYNTTFTDFAAQGVELAPEVKQDFGLH